MSPVSEYEVIWVCIPKVMSNNISGISTFRYSGKYPYPLPQLRRKTFFGASYGSYGSNLFGHNVKLNKIKSQKRTGVQRSPKMGNSKKNIGLGKIT